ncbi:MAG: F0F1 ATP synthase subunit delta [Rickettsia sp.]|nr:F0F1 ATP synthase subunit delta [Rickettsia sp.]
MSHITKIYSYSNIISYYVYKAHQRDVLLKSLQKIFQIFKENKQILKIINSPIIAISKKIVFLEKITYQHPIYLKNILFYILQKELNLILLDKIYLRLEEIFYKNLKIKVFVSSFSEIEQAQKDRIKNFLTDQLKISPVLNFKIDKRLLGGIIIEYDNNLLDFSILGMLNKLKTKLAYKIFD